MPPLDPDYLAELARQFGFLSAFLGGIAATFMAQLLTLHTPRKTVAGCVLLSAGAAISFVVSVLGATVAIAATHPDAPRELQADMQAVRAIMALPFGLGVFLLLADLGLAGWIRSRRTGLLTSAMAAAGVLLGGSTLIGF